MKYCHTLVKYNQLFKGKPSFQIASSLKFNKIGKKIIKFRAISCCTSFQGVSKGGLHTECKSCLVSGRAVNEWAQAALCKAWSRGTIFPKRLGITGKCYDCMAETLNVYLNSFLSLRKSLFLHTKENKVKSPSCWVGFLRIHISAVPAQDLLWVQTWVRRKNKPKTNKKTLPFSYRS